VVEVVEKRDDMRDEMIIDMVNVGGVYQIVNPHVIHLPDLTKRERVKAIQKDYIDFGRPVKSSPKYEIQPRSILIASVHLECKRQDTAFSYALGKAAGYKLMELGEDPLSIIDEVEARYKPPKPKKYKDGWILQADGSFIRLSSKKDHVSARLHPSGPPWDNYCRRPHLMEGEVHCG
jgi:hypothetical protein